MLVLIGYALVLASVFGGFAAGGGHLGALLQPIELVMIGGAALGAFVVSNPWKTTRATLGSLPSCLRGSKYNKALYMELMSLLYALLNKVRKEGLMSIERDVEAPKESALFGQYPRVLNDQIGRASCRERV
jgi:chemotaxis protein MotA